MDRKKYKVKDRDWVPYIMEHWNSKGKPLTVHGTGTALHKKIIHRVNIALKSHSRKVICNRIDKYYYLLTETDLRHRVKYNPTGLVVSLAEFFLFRPETRRDRGFQFEFASWFEEVGRPDVVRRHSAGNSAIADKIGAAFKKHIGFKANQVQLMRASKMLITVAVKYKGQLKGVFLIEELIKVIRLYDPYAAGIVCQPFVYNMLDEILKSKVKKPPKRKLRLLQRSHEVPEFVSSWEKKLNAEKKNTAKENR